MTYISSDDLKSSLDLTGETYADADIDRAVAAASRQIDDQCNRTFTLSEGSVRYYTPDTCDLLDLDDTVSLAELAVGPGDGTFPTVLAINADFILEPLNAAADVEPYTSVRLTRGRHFNPCNRRSVRVTGQFGWPEVPDTVTAAASLLSARLLRRMREAPFGIVTIGLDGQPARIAQTDPDICNMLKPLTRLLVA